MNEKEILHIINDISGKMCKTCLFLSLPGNKEPCNSCYGGEKFQVKLTNSSTWLIGENGEYICDRCSYVTRNDTKFCPQCGSFIVSIERYKND